MGKLNIPSIVGIDTSGIPVSMTLFLQALRDALVTIDENVIYKDRVNAVVQTPRILTKSAEGQVFLVQNTALASGDDYATLVNDVAAVIEDKKNLANTLDQLISELRGE